MTRDKVTAFAQRQHEEGRQRRLAVWRHNALRGYAKCMMANAVAVISAPTTTDEAREIARVIYAQAADLSLALRKRRPE